MGGLVRILPRVCARHHRQVLDDAGSNDVGDYSAIAIGSDGFPVVSYHDDTLGTLKVAKCMDASCASGTIVTTVDDHPVNAVGSFTSIAIGADGFPVISYRDETAGGLKVAKCVNVNCTGLNVITNVDNPPNDVGWDTWIGIGTDGHIGFNEPCSSLASRTRIKTLTEQTRIDNARFFDGDIDQVPHHVITQGIGTILEARHLVLLATGEGKADAIAAAVEGPVSSMCPASILQFHEHATVIVDEAAASRLRMADYYKYTYDNKPAWQL